MDRKDDMICLSKEQLAHKIEDIGNKVLERVGQRVNRPDSAAFPIEGQSPPLAAIAPNSDVDQLRNRSSWTARIFLTHLSM